MKMIGGRTTRHDRGGNTLGRLCLAAMALALVSLSQGQTRRALVIGLGEQEDKAWSKINGDRDVELVDEMLRDAGYQDVTNLVNAQATKANIVKAFETLRGKCQRGDIVYVHFSGHGQQMTDTDGDEPDGLDETWVPFDAYRKPCERDHGEKHLTDDEAGDFLSAIRQNIGEEGKLLVVIDACHSGDGTRGGEDDGGAAVRGTWETFGIEQESSGTQTREPKQEEWVTVSACKSYQNNEELAGKNVGKLTYALCELARGGARSNKEVETQLHAFMRKNQGRLPQTPEITGMTREMSICDVICN